MLLGELQSRLVARVRARINNGEFTERGLARLLGISQPQLHNVLKGARKLQPELADRLMIRFEMGILDLLRSEELNRVLESKPGEPSLPCPLCPFESGEPVHRKPEPVTIIRKPPSRRLSIDPHTFKSTG